MTTSIHPDLFALADAVEVLSSTRYVILGEIRDWGSAVSGQPPTVPLCLPVLERELYTRLYTRSSSPAAAPVDFLARTDHIEALSAANCGRGSWESGWVLGAMDDDDRITVEKDGIVYWVAPSGIRARGKAVRPGESCRVWVPKELRHLDPDYYLAIGDADQGDRRGRPGPMVRFYWHLTGSAAVPYIAAVTEVLNARKVPFRSKVLSDPTLYFRADSGVLYVERRHYRRLGDAIEVIHKRIKACLNRQVPLFTKPLATGLGLAEDPRNGMSFGQHRCKLVAQGLWRSYLQGDRTRDSRAHTLAEAFRQAGLRPAFPYLSPGSRDQYALRPKGGSSSRSPDGKDTAITSKTRRKRRKS